MKQRSPQWFDMRKGKATASDAFNLLSVGKRLMTEIELKDFKEANPKSRVTTIACIGDGLDTYAFEKATEIVYGIDEEDGFQSADMIRGVTLEPIAFAKFQELKAEEFIEVKECSFFPFGTDAGASPDGSVGEDACLEIKCPRPNKFFKIVAKGISEIDPKYIAQMQFQMLCSKSKRCHFFNYIIFNGVEMWHEIIIDRDDEMIDRLKSGLNDFVRLRNEYVSYLIENQQFETITI